MRIAIVGAGLAGLACAHELERLGFTADIYEQRPDVGKRLHMVEFMAQFMQMEPHRDIFDAIRKDLHLPLNPSSYVTSVVAHSPNHTTTISGRVGYFTIRGDDDRSLERQLARHVVSPIQFNQRPDVRQLAQKYDWVVVTGDPEWTRHLGNWKPQTTWWARGAIVSGDFNPLEGLFWFDTGYAGTGHVLLQPFDEHLAVVGVGMTDSSAAESEHYWQTFRQAQCHLWQAEEEQFHYHNAQSGLVRTPVLGNILFVGAAGGFWESLGMTGQVPALYSGVYAARKIALGDRSLERFFRRWRVYSERMWRLRRHVNSWTDVDMDRLVLGLSHGVGNALIHSPWNLLVPSAVVIDALRFADDPSSGIGKQ